MKSLFFLALIFIYSNCSYLRRDNNLLNNSDDNIDSLKEVIKTLISKLDSMKEGTDHHFKYCISA